MGGGGGYNNWTLITGKDPSEIIEKLGSEMRFDFLVLDTAHIHPIESLNFLTVLPFLSDDAVVVLHDISNYHIWNRIGANLKSGFACKLLFDMVVADKLTLQNKEYLSSYIFPNIGVFQLNADSRKYIHDVFSMLLFPWGLFTDKIAEIGAIIKKYYEPKCIDTFAAAVKANLALRLNNFKSYNISPSVHMPNYYKAFDIFSEAKIIFYGAGSAARMVLKKDRLIPTEIWDINADVIGNINGIPVVKPDYESLSAGSSDSVVITIDKQKSPEVVRDVIMKLYNTGFANVYHYTELID